MTEHHNTKSYDYLKSFRCIKRNNLHFFWSGTHVEIYECNPLEIGHEAEICFIHENMNKESLQDYISYHEKIIAGLTAIVNGKTF